jgi:hypothetical protein
VHRALVMLAGAGIMSRCAQGLPLQQQAHEVLGLWLVLCTGSTWFRPWGLSACGRAWHGRAVVVDRTEHHVHLPVVHGGFGTSSAHTVIST